jgi:dTDP-4-dehydrorhamnose 3,5-epimerase-like enzyme
VPHNLGVHETGAGPDHWPRRSKAPEIAGVERIRLESHGDAGGVSTQVFRREWQLGIHPAQWNAVQSEANVLRGVHVQVVHEDYIVLLTRVT